MTTPLLLLFALIFGYLVGSIPPGFFYVKWATGQDLRTVESGRTGGTNSFRAAGAKVGLATGASDILKGLLAFVIAGWLFGSIDNPVWAQVAAGIGSVIGHNWSLFLGFKGGAGTTPNVGWATAVFWPMLPIALAIGFSIFYFVGMASVISLALGAFLPVVFGIRYFLGYDPTAAYLIGSLITCAFITWSLRPNIKRLLAGNERVVGPRAKRMAKRNTVSAD